MQDNGQKNGVTRSAIARLSLIGLTFVALLLGVLPAHAQNTSIFGPNVYVFTPSMSASSINTTLNTLNGNSQFSTNRYAALFMPGTYTGVEAEVGYYESVAGLGEAPSAVSINNGYLEANQSGGNSTLMFWRSLGNMSITPPSGTVLAVGCFAGDFFPAYGRQWRDGADHFIVRVWKWWIHQRYGDHRGTQRLRPAAVVYTQ